MGNSYELGTCIGDSWRRWYEAIMRADVVYGWLPGGELSERQVVEIAYALSLRKVPTLGTGNARLTAPWDAAGYVCSTMLSCSDERQFERLLGIIVSHGLGRQFGAPWSPEWDLELTKCQSPIELRLGLHLLQELSSLVQVEFQHTVKLGGECKRLDFAIVQKQDDGPETKAFKLAIEADGHDWHERTKEQARRDKSRDRALVANGWTMLHFTGSEIWQDPSVCSKEVYRVVLSLAGWS